LALNGTVGVQASGRGPSSYAAQLPTPTGRSVQQGAPEVFFGQAYSNFHIADYRKIANRELLADIRRVHADHRGRYGVPRIHAKLRAEGQSVSRKRIERVMRRHGIRASMPRRYRVCTTDSKHSLPVAANLLDQNFAAEKPDQIWLADIT
jgi:hypothetical protein